MILLSAGYSYNAKWRLLNLFQLIVFYVIRYIFNLKVK